MAIVLLLALLAAGAHAQDLAEKSELAKEAMARGDFAAAISLYEELNRALPNNAGLVMNLGLAQYSAGNYTQAAGTFQRVIKLNPRITPARLLLGLTYLKLGKTAEAVGPLEKALEAEPGNKTALLEVADAYQILGRYGEAVRRFGELARAEGGSAKAWYGLGLCHEELARELSRKLEGIAPDSAYAAALAASWRARDQQYISAVRLYRTALARAPGLRGAHASVAAIYRAAEHADWAAAEDEKEKALKEPDCGRAPLECEFTSGRFEELVRSAAETPEALYWRARAHQELSMAAFARLQELPASVESHRLAAERYERQGRYPDAAQEWQAAFSLAPREAPVQKGLARALWLARDYESALPVLQDLLKAEPESAPLNYQLGDALLELKGPVAALPYLEKAVKLAPQVMEARASLGRALLREGKAADAIPHLEAALPADRDGSSHYQLVRAYQSVGRQEDARRTLARHEELKRESAETTSSGELPPPD